MNKRTRNSGKKTIQFTNSDIIDNALASFSRCLVMLVRAHFRMLFVRGVYNRELTAGPPKKGRLWNPLNFLNLGSRKRNSSFAAIVPLGWVSHVCAALQPPASPHSSCYLPVGAVDLRAVRQASRGAARSKWPSQWRRSSAPRPPRPRRLGPGRLPRPRCSHRATQPALRSCSANARFGPKWTIRVLHIRRPGGAAPPAQLCRRL